MTRTPARVATAYGQAAQTIPPLRQVVMLYDGAIARLHEARQAIADGRIEDRFNAVQKASRIVDALHSCLDFDRGGEVAPLLDRVYTCISLRMQRINTGNDAAVCDEVIARLGELRDAWRALAEDRACPAGAQTPKPASIAA
jgi:flagellar secretion chaperone FliS